MPGYVAGEGKAHQGSTERRFPTAKLFAVGDDWQSIYRFAGSDIDVFTRFANHFGVTATNYLTQTFRSNQGITDIAAGFVQKNPSQMSKRFEARDPKSRAPSSFDGISR